MELFEGVYYKRRDGEKAGPAVFWPGSRECCSWVVPGASGHQATYFPNGRRIAEGYEDPEDLIAEWSDELPHDGTVAMDAIPATPMSLADEVRAIVTEVFSEPDGPGVGPATGLTPDELLQELDAREHEPKPTEYRDRYRPKAAPGYEPLFVTLLEAHDQAAIGKGRARHANGKPFLEQPIMEIGRMVGVGYQTGQAMKKSQEASGMLARGDYGPAKAELLGAINYLAAAYILIEEQQDAAIAHSTPTQTEAYSAADL